MESTTFSRVYKNILGHPSVASNALEISRTFNALVGDEERIKFIVQLDALKNFKYPILTRGKDEKKAESARKNGNIFFSKRDLEKSLEAFNESVTFADSKHTRSLAYANRSAVLFECGRLQDSLEDIERSFSEGYPPELSPKLYYRKANILSKVGRVSEAVEIAEKGLKFSKNIIESDSWISKLSKLSESFAELGVDGDGKVGDVANAPEDHGVFPSLNEANPLYPSASSAIIVEYAEGRGRYFVAKRDIIPGEVLMVEKPYASCLLPSAFKSNCQNCFRGCDLPVPCLKCSMVVFCSEKCRTESVWFHDIECLAMESIYDDEFGDTAYLSFRTMLTKTFSAWKLFSKSSLASGKGENDKFNISEEIYDPGDYSNVYKLVKNSSERNPSDLFKRTLMALILADILCQTAYENEVLDDDLKTFLGGLMLRHLQNYPCNAHAVDELCIRNPVDMLGAQGVQIAEAVYPTLSLLNHSCDPSTVRVHYGDIAVVYAIQAVKSGEAIYCNYGAHYALTKKAERQMSLKKQYFFECSCPPCLHDWPIYDALWRTGDRYKCPKCGTKSLNNKIPSCQSCKEDLSTLWSTVEVMKSNYARFYAKVVSNECIDECMAFLVDYLRFLHDVIVRPSAEFNDCQETLKQCMIVKGNRRFIK
ncbi:unnamed protein product [Notodromas monacha]|uniref:Protein-lysine N-methyltransferase SMYD4 n=1 Tax=Notodromas monacha TaxID=399045 RepID=A0A7R9BPC2_9CRUS|nr:unnamed protein product [Notodromas monacha]CAG0917823.1 unnamed protein product [Notodromas monacha]